MQDNTAQNYDLDQILTNFSNQVKSYIEEEVKKQVTEKQESAMVEEKNSFDSSKKENVGIQEKIEEKRDPLKELEELLAKAKTKINHDAKPLPQDELAEDKVNNTHLGNNMMSDMVDSVSKKSDSFNDFTVPYENSQPKIEDKADLEQSNINYQEKNNNLVSPSADGYKLDGTIDSARFLLNTVKNKKA